MNLKFYFMQIHKKFWKFLAIQISTVEPLYNRHFGTSNFGCNIWVFNNNYNHNHTGKKVIVCESSLHKVINQLTVHVMNIIKHCWRNLACNILLLLYLLLYSLWSWNCTGYYAHSYKQRAFAIKWYSLCLPWRKYLHSACNEPQSSITELTVSSRTEVVVDVTKW